MIRLKELNKAIQESSDCYLRLTEAQIIFIQRVRVLLDLKKEHERIESIKRENARIFRTNPIYILKRKRYKTK